MEAALFCILLFYQISVSASQNASRHLCRNDQSIALFLFKQSFNIDASASLQCESNGQPSYPKTKSWNSRKDCCTWDGVTCDELTGQVIGLDLSCSQLQGGVIDSNSTIFQLSHLERINLAYNDFSSSNISHRFGELESLTHFNISSSGFSGQFPPEFLRLSRLVSLDISLTSDPIQIDPSTFRFLLQNLSKLSEVSLAGVDISSTIPNNLTASLTLLNLGSTSLIGRLPDEIYQLPNLQNLKLFSNPGLTGKLPKLPWKSSNTLTYLDLSDTGLSGEVPESIGSLRQLNYLDLSSCSFWGSLPRSLWNLTELNQLILFSNNFTGELPASGLANLRKLIRFDLSSNSLQGQIPDTFQHFVMLTDLSLSDNFFTGQFPSSLTNLTQLESLNLSNNSLIGPIPSAVAGFPNMLLLFLFDNSFNWTIPSWIFNLPSIRFLDLHSNQLRGQIYYFQSMSLKQVDLSENNLHGTLPNSFSKLDNLTDLYISSNNLSGEVDISTFSSMSQLENLDISYNNLSLTNNALNASWPKSLNSLFISGCHVKNLDLLRSASNLFKLDLSSIMLQGELPKWMGNQWSESLFYLNLSHNHLTHVSNLPFQNLVYLDLRDNLLQGSIIIPPDSIQVFFTSNNNLSGEIPSSICNLPRLTILDLSNNSFGGVIPGCLFNISSGLSVLDMHSNRFQGEIPSEFGSGSELRSLNLRNNQLEGTVPRSMSKCTELEVIDLGQNTLNGTFPEWLGFLPKLKVLSLRSNNMHGTVNISKQNGSSFPALRILDLSGNHLTGILTGTFFKHLMGMTETDRSPAFYIGEDLYQDSVQVVVKGQEINLIRILSIFTAIDLSRNNFKGKIPDEIGNLVSLRGLNLSHNFMTGEIPSVLGNLSALETLDLSSNQLSGEIPHQLRSLHFLSVLNLSENHFVGQIPQGNQFDTFENGSYLGNSGLCGSPLSNACVKATPPPPVAGEEEEEGFIDGVSWESVVIGYGSGTIVGMAVTWAMFITGKPGWFNTTVEALEKKLNSRRRKRKEITWLLS